MVIRDTIVDLAVRAPHTSFLKLVPSFTPAWSSKRRRYMAPDYEPTPSIVQESMTPSSAETYAAAITEAVINHERSVFNRGITVNVCRSVPSVHAGGKKYQESGSVLPPTKGKSNLEEGKQVGGEVASAIA